MMLVFAGKAVAGATVLVLNDVNEPPLTTADHSGFLDIIAAEMFRRVGVEFRLAKLPAERSLLDSNAGIGDGDLTRISGLEVQYPNLVRVPEALVEWEFAAFSKDAAMPATWEGIRQRPRAYIKGWKIYEQYASGADRVVTADDPDQLFRLLEMNRVDVVLYEYATGTAFISAKGLTDIHPLNPPLTTRDMYIYLHKRHAELVPRLAAALRTMKRDGFYQRAYRDILKPYRGMR